jgi:excisionase family DNA binding protein
MAKLPSSVASCAEPIAARIPEVSRLTGISRSEIYRLLADGKLKGKKSGRSTLVLMSSVAEYLDSLPPATYRARDR